MRESTPASDPQWNSQSTTMPIDNDHLHPRPDTNLLEAEQESVSAQTHTMPLGFTLSETSTAAESSRPALDQAGSKSYTAFLRDVLQTSPEAIAGDLAPLPTIYDNDEPAFWADYLATDDLPVLGECSLPDLTSEVHLPEPAGGDDQSESAASVVGAEAFRASVWNWIPGPSDTGTAEQHSLALPDSVKQQIAHDLANRSDPMLASLSLSTADRERTLAVLLAHCDRSNLFAIVSSFPTAPLMQKLVQISLAHQDSSSLSWFHAPTFQISNIRAELLAALVAHGATLAPIKAVQRLGCAIPDLLLQAIKAVWHSHNSHSRDVELLQAWALCLQIWYWSGSKRMMELGEGVAQPAITVLKRSGMLQRHRYKEIAPTQSDSDAGLNHKWHDWIQQETQIRMCHHFFVHDAETSMTQFNGPMLSYAEMNLPLPSAEEFWRASSAHQWRLLYQQQSIVERPKSLSVASCVREAVHLKSLRQYNPSSLTLLLTVYGLWGLVHEHRQLQHVMMADYQSDEPSSPLCTSRHEALSQMVAKFASSLTESTSGLSEPATLLLMQHFLSLALAAPLRALTSFAGKNGTEEAQRVFPFLQEWVRSRLGREGIWHAGQVLKYARQIPPYRMRDFYAAAVFDASLVLWTHGIVTTERLRRKGLGGHGNSIRATVSRHVSLDGDMTHRVRRFLAIDDREPVVFCDVSANSAGPQEYSSATAPLSEMAPVRDASATMEAAMEILKRHVAQCRSSAFVESLVQLMGELSLASQALRL